MSSWKKSILSVLLVILVLPLLFCNVDASKASKAKKEKKAYKKYVSAHKVSRPYSPEMKNPDYKIVDVNGDKIPELLFVNRKDYYLEVWTFRGGHMYRMFRDGIGKTGSFAYKKSKHLVGAIYMNTGGYDMYVYKAKKKKLKKTKTHLWWDGIDYSINNKKVKKKVLKKAWNKYKVTDPWWKIK